MVHNWGPYIIVPAEPKPYQYEPFNNPLLRTPHKYPDELLHRYTEPKPIPRHEGHVGEMGEKVAVPIKRLQEAKHRFKEHGFSIVISDLILYNRSLPDIRSEACVYTHKRVYTF